MLHFTADTHLGHAKMYGRPRFRNVDEHDTFIINRWNEVVADTDVVYVVGDFVWPQAQDSLSRYRERLRGYIYLVPGDHDVADAEAPQFEILNNIVDIKYEDQHVVLSHWPQQHWRRSHYGSWHCYGHLHHADVDRGWGKRVQVGVDRFNYYPVSIHDLKEIMALLPDNPNLIRRNDAHTPDVN